MERKGVGSTVAVAAESVKTALGKVRELVLAPDEERALRMRYGAASDLSKPLARAAGPRLDLDDELRCFEAVLLRASRERFGPRPAPSKAKAKIVRALRRKR